MPPHPTPSQSAPLCPTTTNHTPARPGHPLPTPPRYILCTATPRYPTKIQPQLTLPQPAQPLEVECVSGCCRYVWGGDNEWAATKNNILPHMFVHTSLIISLCLYLFLSRQINFNGGQSRQAELPRAPSVARPATCWPRLKNSWRTGRQDHPRPPMQLARDGLWRPLDWPQHPPCIPLHLSGGGSWRLVDWPT